MSSQSAKEGSTYKLDSLKWFVVVVLLFAGVLANHYFTEVQPLPWALRATGWIVLFAVATFIALQTAKGASFWGFVKSSRGELRKVVWPNRPEIIQTTLIVVGMVVLTAIVLWAFDSFFLYVVGWLTGQRG